jgi:hypothetical protein
MRVLIGTRDATDGEPDENRWGDKGIHHIRAVIPDRLRG